ncbi:MAG: hypothetical protein HOH74_23990, partial [Gemmatimonadetes bacterium]|nr:hypothetical protein [Gemmatimonadota bacterium]
MDVTSLLHRRWFPAALVCFAVCLAHLQAPGAEEFHYDDGHSLVRNLHLRDLNNLPLFFADASLFGENPEDRMYRPLVLVTHSLNLAFSGLEPGGFVAVNLLIHALSAGLATWLLCLMLPPWTALAGGLLFGLHPLQSEVIHYASARSESMAGLFV